MDVITTIKPENHIARPRTSLASLISRKATAPHRESGFHEPLYRNHGEAPKSRQPGAPAFSLSFLGENPAVVSFPVILLLVMSLSVSLTPLFQSRFGFYRLDRMDFPSDSSSESAMRLMVSPEPDAALLAESAANDLPVTIRTVSYSSWKVRSGDTLGGILARFGLRNISTLLSANRIDNARRIKVGSTLTVPSMDGLMYTVVRGDSLARVSGRYAVPVNAILDANDLSEATLRAGQRLFIPGATLSASELRRAMGEVFMLPLKGRLTSRFGWRSDPFTGVRTFHTGIDLAAPYGSPIKATLAGKVATTGYSAVFGNYVILSHDGGFQTLYGHMSAINVTRGERVVQGALVGRVGNTGYSTGCHLHLSVYKNGKMVDPYSVLN